MKHSLFILFACATLAACSSSNNTGLTSANKQDINIPFSAVAGDTAITCDATLTPVGSAAGSASILNFKFYVHNVILSGDDGNDYTVTLTDNDWQDQGVALLDFNDRSTDPDPCSGTVRATNTELSGTVSASTDVSFEGITFSIGVPANLNHIGRTNFGAGSVLNLSSMDWSWQNGHKHMRLDVDPAEGALTSWNFHLGTTGCSGGSSTEPELVTCLRSNIPTITLNSYRQGSDTIEFDYAALVSDTDITVSSDPAPGCMSGPTDTNDCTEVFLKLGLDHSTGNAHGSTMQSAFSVQ